MMKNNIKYSRYFMTDGQLISTFSGKKQTS